MMMKLTQSIKKYFKCIVACSMNSKNVVKIQIACFMDTTNLGLQCMMATADELYKKIVSAFMIYFQDRKEFEKLLTVTFFPFWMRVDWALLLFSRYPVCVYFENANAHLKISLFPSLFQFMLKLLQFPYRDSLKTFLCVPPTIETDCVWGKKQLPSSYLF